LKSFTTGEYKSALKAKGFRSERTTRDEVFYLYVDSKKTSIHTKVSLGSSEDIGRTLMGMIKKQLCLDNNAIERFIGCPMKFEEFVGVLRSQGKL
jgi:hypothetical protein